MNAAEFTRPVRLDTVGEDRRTLTVEATAEERAGLARRFGLLALDRLTATVELRRAGERISAAGELEADVAQACVAGGAEVRQTVALPFALRFVPEAEAGSEEIELGEKELDDITYEGGSIDVGEAVAQTLVLGLDPFPRAPDADAALRAAGVLSEEDAGPFAKLKGLRDKLGG